jgi:drug/metabolite transporter (DMT)-like permease
LVLTPIVWSRYRAELAQLRRSDLALVLLSGLLLAVHFASWITSLEYTSVSTSTVLVSTNSLWVALASPFLLRERLSRVTLIAVVIAVVGVFWISATGDTGTALHQGQSALGNVLALIGAVAVGGYYMCGRRVRAKVSVIPYIWLTYGTASIVLIAVVLVTGQQVVGLAPDAYFWMTLIGIFPQLIGHSAYNYALGYLSAAYVSLTIPVEPIGATILAAILLREPLVPQHIFGGALILLALVVASREESRTTREVQREAAAT